MPVEIDWSRVTLAILAGGEGRRMGRPKAELRINGKLILQHLLDQYAWPGPTLLVTSPGREHPPAWERFDREVSDPRSGEGPLQGVVTALKECAPPIVVIVPVDMPALTSSQLKFVASKLIENPARIGIMFQPFPIAIRTSAGESVAHHFASGQRAIKSLLRISGIESEAAPPDWPDAIWTNLNSPSDLPQVLRYHDGVVTEVSDELAEEEPLEIRVRGRAISVTMRTPGHDDELAAGFLLSEGLIKSQRDIAGIEPCDRNEDGNLLNVVLAPEVRVDFERLTRHVFASSSCGLCGKATIDAIRAIFPPVESDIKVNSETIASLPSAMRAAQKTFDRTGGLHAAGLFDRSGRLIVLREDVGRHNAVDKVLGHALLNGLLPLDQHILLVSGRSSFEIMQKALAGRVPIVAAVSAPSSLAVQFAQESGQTLIGFLRERRMNVYTNPQRIVFQERACTK